MIHIALCFLGNTPLSRQFEFQKPLVQLPEAIYKNSILSKLEWKNLNVPEQILVQNPFQIWFTEDIKIYLLYFCIDRKFLRNIRPTTYGSCVVSHSKMICPFWKLSFLLSTVKLEARAGRSSLTILTLLIIRYDQIN